ncbi:MAG: FAD:protein FMN transferase [Patescibacteria group bacterium]|nr:FAD:protein FMN transferase [Patescibacteria group bacterium]MDE1943909.1 FAD:protein FMN transferase [Patescibacteria group bacterium]MDE1944873.1 FAD:protein FMN transferase [Patescibacteria group bacterium]MDE2057742.1 FAD:protein FMN transferase [Patescibacteria group bacterium]
MRFERDSMGMPIALEIVDAGREAEAERVFDYFAAVDARFSTYKGDSEIARINRGELSEGEWSRQMREVMALAERTRQESAGYFDIRRPDGALDPSGVVKGWAILNAAKRLEDAGVTHFYIDAGGDIALAGRNARGEEWSVGIRHPVRRDEIVKVVYPRGKGVATSGNYLRGAHIYDPHTALPPAGVVSLTVIGPDVLEADRFATAAFAMGERGIAFIEGLPGFEGYQIGETGVATMTSGFAAYTAP